MTNLITPQYIFAGDGSEKLILVLRIGEALDADGVIRGRLRVDPAAAHGAAQPLFAWERRAGDEPRSRPGEPEATEITRSEVKFYSPKQDASRTRCGPFGVRWALCSKESATKCEQ